MTSIDFDADDARLANVFKFFFLGMILLTFVVGMIILYA